MDLSPRIRLSLICRDPSIQVRGKIKCSPCNYEQITRWTLTLLGKIWQQFSCLSPLSVHIHRAGSCVPMACYGTKGCNTVTIMSPPPATQPCDQVSINIWRAQTWQWADFSQQSVVFNPAIWFKYGNSRWNRNLLFSKCTQPGGCLANSGDDGFIKWFKVNIKSEPQARDEPPTKSLLRIEADDNCRQRINCHI